MNGNRMVTCALRIAALTLAAGFAVETAQADPIVISRGSIGVGGMVFQNGVRPRLRRIDRGADLQVRVAARRLTSSETNTFRDVG